jgi:two-component system sensor histidine kinase/response regulator
MSGCDRSFLPGDGGPTPRTVLVVEDDASTLETLSLFLQDEGYRVLQATSGVAALSLMRQVRPALILSDAIMPGMDGFALCELVRAEPRWSQIPFIFLSGISQRTDVRHGMGLGADDYLAKPVEPEELLSAIRVRLARADEAQVALTNATSDLRDAIIRTLSHEFRTPLSLVLGYTDLIESTIRETADQELHQFLQGLRSGIEHLMGLLEGFLLLSQLQTGALAAERRREPPQSSLADLIVSQVLEGFA